MALLSNLPLIIALVVLLVLVVLFAEVVWGTRRLSALKDILPLEDIGAPTVSVIAAARNEERNVEAALKSLLTLDYPNLEIIIINDRSTDRTGEILERLRQRHPSLRVEHIETLPSGWLGKNHALQYGAQRAKGQYILFTDADVVMEPTAVKRAMRYVLHNRLDHLAISPVTDVPGVLLNVTVAAFVLCFGIFARPWRARDPKSWFHIGIGAFNLVRAEAYRSFGGHQPIALRPDDDLKLGRLMKKNGFRQDFLFGRCMVWVEWYSSLREMISGFEKNGFSGFEYSLGLMLIGCLGQLALFVLPFVAVFLVGGWAQVVFGCTAVFSIAALAAHLPAHGMSRWYALGLPVGMLLMQVAIWNSTIKALAHGGIRWRGTFYSLRDLKGNRV